MPAGQPSQPASQPVKQGASTGSLSVRRVRVRAGVTKSGNFVERRTKMHGRPATHFFFYYACERAREPHSSKVLPGAVGASWRAHANIASELERPGLDDIRQRNTYMVRHGNDKYETASCVRVAVQMRTPSAGSATPKQAVREEAEGDWRLLDEFVCMCVCAFVFACWGVFVCVCVCVGTGRRGAPFRRALPKRAGVLYVFPVGLGIGRQRTHTSCCPAT